MRVFELHFNSKGKEDKLIENFSYEPENVYEKRLGNLYMVGELNQAMPQNSRFLNNLAVLIKQEYYKGGLKKSCEVSLRDSLKKANEFLDQEVRKGNVSWLGNVNFAILDFKEFVLNFTRIGDVKILLQRNEGLSDISQNLEFQDIEPYPLKLFGSIATGKLSPDDKIIVLTKDVFSALNQDEGFLSKLSKTSDEKELKEIINTKKQTLSEISGICLLLMVDGEKEVMKFSFRETFKIPKIKFIISKKKIILVLALILILAIGFLIFR